MQNLAQLKRPGQLLQDIHLQPMSENRHSSRATGRSLFGRLPGGLTRAMRALFPQQGEHGSRQKSVRHAAASVSVAAGLILGYASLIRADTHYVSPCGTQVYPYTNWVTAAREIQHAVEVADDGDTVLVTNGVYSTGGAVTPGHSLSNRVVIEKRIAVHYCRESS